MWLGGHVTRDLSAYCHGELPADRERAVRAHLEACARCRAAHDEIRFGVALASHIEAAPAPESIWTNVRDRLATPAGAPGGPAVEDRVNARGEARGGLTRPVLTAAAVFLALVAGVGILRRSAPRHTGTGSPRDTGANGADQVTRGTEQARSEQLELVTASAPPTAFEAAARDAHLQRLAGALKFDYVTAAPETLRPWLREHAGFDLSLAVVRPPGDAGRFQLLGAKVIRAAGARAALVGYEVDSRPVTLVSAPLRDVPDPPEELHLRKKVAIRFDAARGLKLLTWGADGQAYVLVSDLPAAGTDACGICHTSPERRALIREAQVRTGT